jgi:hypothetical protein
VISKARKRKKPSKPFAEAAADALPEPAEVAEEEGSMVSLLLEHWHGVLTDTEKEELLQAAQAENLERVQQILTDVENAKQAHELYELVVGASERGAKAGVADGMRKRHPALASIEFPPRPVHTGDLLAAGDLENSFALLNPNVTWWARNRSSQLIVELDQEVRRDVMNLVGQSVAGEWTKDELAQRIAREVGLHSRYQRAVVNSRALNYARLVKDHTPAQAAGMADRAADRYAAHLRRVRAQSIARTELVFAQNNGVYLGWLQAAQTQPPQLMYKKWETAEDEDVCPICGPMDQKAVALTNPFTLPNGFTCLVPPAHPNCRCTCSLVNLTLNPDRVLDIQGDPNVMTTNVVEAQPATPIDSGVYA